MRSKNLNLYILKDIFPFFLFNYACNLEETKGYKKINKIKNKNGQKC